MADTKPGDGKQNPFGNGKGGSMAASGGGNDFSRNPNGGGSTSGGPGWLDAAKSRPQKTGEEEFKSKDSIPEGGPLPFGKNTDTSQDQGNPIGIGSGGNKPFKLDGGG